MYHANAWTNTNPHDQAVLYQTFPLGWTAARLLGTIGRIWTYLDTIGQMSYHVELSADMSKLMNIPRHSLPEATETASLTS